LGSSEKKKKGKVEQIVPTAEAIKYGIDIYLTTRIMKNVVLFIYWEGEMIKICLLL